MESSLIQPHQLDDIDRKILRILEENGNIANKDLAAVVGVAPSTTSARVKALTDNGIIRGIYADIDPQLVGQGLQAMIAVRLHAGSRMDMDTFGKTMAALHGVQDVYFVGGLDDYLIHVCMRDTAELSDFVSHQLNNNPAVANTQTMLIFEHHHHSIL